MRKLMAIAAVLAVAAAGPTWAAQGGKRGGAVKMANLSKVSGTVQSIDTAAKKIDVKTPTGEVKTYTLSDKTKARRDKKPMALSSIKTGDKVKVLRYNKDNNVAMRILIGK